MKYDQTDFEKLMNVSINETCIKADFQFIWVTNNLFNQLYLTSQPDGHIQYYKSDFENLINVNIKEADFKLLATSDSFFLSLRVTNDLDM